MDIFEVSRENIIREFFMKKKFISDDLELSNLAKKRQKYSAGNGGFRLFSHRFFTVPYCSVPNFRAVTLLWAKIMRVLLLVSKSGTSASPLFILIFLFVGFTTLMTIIEF